MSQDSETSVWKALALALLGVIVGGLAAVGFYWLVRRRSEKMRVALPERELEHLHAPSEPRAPGKVLVVDDDRDFCDLTSAILTQAGYQVTTASSADEAFRAMQHSRPDLVLLDVMMTAPLEGVSIARKMSADRDLGKIPIVMISGIASTEYAEVFPKDTDIPIDAWISRPVDPDQVLTTVRRILPQ